MIGTVGVAKAVLYDVSDNTNQAFSMSMLSIAWGLGLILGPTSGATKYPSVFSPQGFFADYPFLLPSFCCFLVCGVVAVIMFFQFEDPALVRNKEMHMYSHQHKCNAVDIAKEDDDDPDPKTASSGGSIPSSALSSGQQPLLERRRFQSIASTPIPISAKTHMSLENLHCELELSHYYAAQVCTNQSRRASMMSRGSRFTTKSMQKKGVDGLLPETRKSSYSHEHKTPQSDVETDGVNMMNVKLNHVSPKGEEKAKEAGIGVVSEKWGEREGGGGGFGEGEKGGGGGGGVGGNRGSDVAVDLNEGHRGKSLETERSGSCWVSVRNSAFVQLIRQRDVILSVALYTVMAFAVLGFEDLFTIFASTAIEYDGLGFSTDEIGIALGAISIPLLVVQLKLYPTLVAMLGIKRMFIQLKLYPLWMSRFGVKRTYIITLFFIIVPIQLMPMVHLLADNKVWLWVCLVVLILSLRVAANSCFTGSSLLLNNSVTSRETGKVNGLGMTCTALARTLAPTITGAMFSWSLKMRKIVGPPLDVNLTFVFLGFVLFLSAVQCVFLPDHLDHQKK
ncbi:hypothetical protein ACOMHN_018129 [Nucella lapillus]